MDDQEEKQLLEHIKEQGKTMKLLAEQLEKSHKKIVNLEERLSTIERNSQQDAAWIVALSAVVRSLSLSSANPTEIEDKLNANLASLQVQPTFLVDHRGGFGEIKHLAEQLMPPKLDEQ